MIPRYSRDLMSAIWTDDNRYRLWFEIEVAAAEAMVKKGKVPRRAINVMRKRVRINVAQIQKIEKTVKHDVIAFLTHLEKTIGPEARYLHMGLTSSDVVDTTLALQLKQASAIIETDLNIFIETLRRLARKHKRSAMVGRSHGIHAEPITFGIKVAGWVSEARRNLERFRQAKDAVAFAKLSGAVGTFAHNPPDIESFVCSKLGLKPEPVATQVVPRDRHAQFMTALALIAGMLERIATEIRHLQRTEVLEVEEPFTKGQKGSSAMPHKRNPIGAENICGLARVIRGNTMAAYENIPLWHERDISHSSVERIILPDSTVLIDYMLARMTDLLSHLQVYPERMKTNLKKTEEFLASEKLLLSLVKKGLDRQKGYEMVQKNALHAWTGGLSFRRLIESDEALTKILSQKEIQECFDTSNHFKHVDLLFKRAGI